MRIVSLLPAASEIVSGLGLCDALVGRSHECDYPPELAELPPLTRARVDSSLPSDRLDAEVRRVLSEGPIYALEEETLAALAPDVVVTQEACAVCAVSYEQVVDSLRRGACRAKVVCLRPARLDDVIGDVRKVAEACGVSRRGDRLAAGLSDRLAALSARMPRPRPRVAVVEWLAPPMLAGHWVPEVIEAAGGIAVGTAPGDASPYIAWDALRALAPDAVVVAPCGFDLDRTVAEAQPVASRLRSLAPRVLLMDGNAYMNRPGPRVVDAAEAIAGWLRGRDIPREVGMSLYT